MSRQSKAAMPSEYRMRPTILHWPGLQYRIYDASKKVQAVVEVKPFRLKEEVVLYSSDKRHKIGRALANRVIDTGVVYALFDRNGLPSLRLKRKYLTSKMAKSTWQIRNHRDEPVAILQEDDALGGILRRVNYLYRLLNPPRYAIKVHHKVAVIIKQSYFPRLIGYRVIVCPDNPLRKHDLFLILALVDFLELS